MRDGDEGEATWGERRVIGAGMSYGVPKQPRDHLQSDKRERGVPFPARVRKRQLDASRAGPARSCLDDGA